MLPCESYQDRLLDHLYGLLDPAEAEAVEAHLAGCPACAAAGEQTARWRGLIAQAAKAEFPGVRFTPPSEAPTAVPSEARGGQPADAVDGRGPRNTVRRAWVGWVVAASLLLTFASLGGTAVRDLIGYFAFKPAVDRETASVLRVQDERERLNQELFAANKRAADRETAAQKKYDGLLDQWVKAEGAAEAAVKDRPFIVQVTGPATALPGAPNQYAVTVIGRDNQPHPAAVVARVKDPAGRVVFEDKFQTDETTTRKPLRLPASLWSGVKPGSELSLSVSATDRAGAQSHLTEAVRLLEPVYTTYLTTDKPVYRPGETVYFRSLTLDRARFLPPDRDLTLQFALRGPDGKPVDGLALSGLAQPVTHTHEPILGPDGKPVRGVGAGAFTLPAWLASGEYTLTVSEVGGSAPRVPPATRTFLVNDYTPDKLQKKLEFGARTYGPGDIVQARLVVLDQTKPVAGARLRFAVTADGQAVTPDAAPAQTDAAGVATVQFTLPRTAEIKDATLTVAVTANGKGTETLVRRVPLATRSVRLEFYPEGGELVAGVPCRVYFRATSATGRPGPVDVSGVLTDGTRTVCEVKTLTDADHPGVNQGLGAFTFTPEPGKRYAVRLGSPAGVVQLAGPFAAALGAAAASPLPAYQLPRVKPTGVVLSVPDGVTRPGEKVRVQLWAAGPKRSVLVGAYVRGRQVATQRAVVEPGKPTELALDFGDAKIGGVTRITVFEEPAGDETGRDDLKPVAERLVFRQPGEVLKLGFTATKADGKPAGGAFAPGGRVELTVTATDEAGRPAPAVLWAAVVNQSVLTMADEKTARLMPTHFLLGGEVQRGDELEHADFLLTDHPKAAAGLDLLLGTQGWRRFAEQAPEQFLARTPAEGKYDADRLVMAMGDRRGVPLSWLRDQRRVFDEYWPKYEDAARELDAAEDDRRTGASTANVRTELLKKEGEYSGRLTALGGAVSELEFFDKSMEARRAWMPVTVGFTFGLGLVLLLARFLRKPGSPERRPLMVGGIGFLAAGLLVLAAVGASQLGNQDWRKVASIAPKPGQNRPWPYPPPPNPAPPIGVQQKQGTPAPMVALTGGVPVPHAVPLPLRRPMDPLLVERLRNDRQPTPALAERVPGRPAEPRQLLPEVARLQRELVRLRQRGVPVDQIARLVPQTPPLVVREYAHIHPTPDPDGPQATKDYAETLLWQPVLVLPQDGRITLQFDLSDESNAYRVLVAGHTLDGRIGATTGVVEVRKPAAPKP